MIGKYLPIEFRSIKTLILPGSASTIVYTDANEHVGAGVTESNGFMFQEIFDKEMHQWSSVPGQLLHINSLEFYSTYRVLASPSLLAYSKTLRVKTDNAASLSWLQTLAIPESVTRDREFLLSVLRLLKDRLKVYDSVSFEFVPTKGVLKNISEF